MTTLTEARKSGLADLCKVEERQKSWLDAVVAADLKGLGYEA